MPNQRSILSLLAIKKIVEETATFTGRDFFQILVKNLAETLDLHGVWVTEYDKRENFLRSIAFWLEGDFVPKYDYCVVGTPCEPVIQSNEIFHVPERVIELFPKDPDLPPLNAVSYVGLALKDERGEVLGHLAALDNKPSPELPEFFAIFKLFAQRAEAELRRMQYELRLKEKEAGLSRMVDGAVNAIFELDEHLQITQLNPSAVQLFGIRKKESIIGQSIKKLLSAKGLKKLGETLASQDTKEEQASFKVPGYLEFQKVSGEPFHAETSITRFVTEGNTFFVFFMVNVQDKLRAQQQLETLKSETSFLKEEIRSLRNPANIIGRSPAVKKACELIRQVGPTDTTVLITGETGTGKELFARAIHEAGHRKEKQMITVNCAALPPDLIESELFGHEKGAFTGALQSRQGRFVLANHSSLFLDEIGEMPVSLQSKLLRVLQEGEVQPIGSTQTIQVDVRIIAATNRNLREEIEKGRFREDLYYRLNVFPIFLPPLRERGDDVIEIAEKFIEKNAGRLNKRNMLLDERNKQALLSYSWPGNIRELHNIIERALIMSTEEHLINIASLLRTSPLSSPGSPIQEQKVFTAAELKEQEKQNILRALNLTDWQISGEQGAAALLGIPPTTLTSKIKAFHLSRTEK